MEKPPIRVMALHALAYCERLFYLEEVEEIRVADDRVFDGRRLHEELEEEGPLVEMQLESESLGIKGKVDAIRRRDGLLIPYEHKKGRAREGDDGYEAWPSDRIQLTAYATLLEEETGRSIEEGRIRYHGSSTTVRVQTDEAARHELDAAIARAKELAGKLERPPVADNDRLCARCSLAPVCLPEESRASEGNDQPLTRLYPARDERRPVHFLSNGGRIGRAGNELKFTSHEGDVSREPIHEVSSVSIHGNISVSSQALQLCASHGIGVHWFTGSQNYTGSFFSDGYAVQRKLRQFEALRESGTRLNLAKRLVHSRAEGQLRFLLRATRQSGRQRCQDCIDGIRAILGQVAKAENSESLLGIEGRAAAWYFDALPNLLTENVDAEMRPNGRSRRPPRDPFNALLSFGYALLLKQIVQAIRSVGLDPAFGFYHRPRSSAPPLALDLMELFRVPVVDMATVAAVNRLQFDPHSDFVRAGTQVWLNDSGRRKLIAIVERRFEDEWRHPRFGYSLSYRRHVELEVRLLEKEWSGEPGLFATTRIR